MIGLISKLFIVPKAIFRSAYFFLAISLVGLLVFIFGHSMLGPWLYGSDNPNFITLADWLSKWFPRIPFWFPQEGAGMSFTISYPILNHLIVVVIEKMFQLPIAVAFRIWSLITVVLTAVGIYILGFRLTKNQTVSGLAAIFYPLMPITWIFLVGWGFTAEQLSFVFIPPVLLFLCLFLDEFYLYGLTRRTKIYFLLLVILFALLPFAHVFIFIGALTIALPLLIIYPLLCYKSKDVTLKKVLLVGFRSIVVILLLSAYWTMPFFRYQSMVARGAPVEKGKTNYNQYLQNGIYPLNVFSVIKETAGYSSYDDAPVARSGWAWHNVSFPFSISILALVGFIGSLFLNRKVFALGLANLLPLALALFPQVTFYLADLPFISDFVSWRAEISTSRIVIPILAGFGCFVLAHLVFFPLDLISKKIKFALIKHPTRWMYVILSTVLSLVVAGILLWHFKSWPNGSPDFLLSYGPEMLAPVVQIDLRDIWARKKINYCFGSAVLLPKKDYPQCYNLPLHQNFWDYKLIDACTKLKEESDNFPDNISQLCGSDPGSEVVKKVIDECNKGSIDSRYLGVCEARIESFWSQFKPEVLLEVYQKSDLFGEGRELWGQERKMLDGLPDNRNTRLDVGTSLGAFMMFEPFYSNIPELAVYYNTGTLIKNFWNYQIGVFNQKKTVWPQDSIMYELSKYFGLEYMVMSENLVPLDKYERTGWERVKKWEKGTYEGLALWKFTEPAGLLRATTKPVVLVIGQDKVDGYFRIFHLANLGILPFEEGLLVKGEGQPDAYTASELAQFDGVILEGYSYNNQKRGWGVLEEYVKKGGSLLINTGWQYSSADWQLAKTPDFFPLKTLKWEEAGTDEDLLNENARIIKDVDVDKFSPLVYGQNPWSVSSSSRSDLRDWARIIISLGDKPLVAGGQYGSGKVVWMGLDLPGHIGAYKDNEEEISLYKKLLSYLLDGKGGGELKTSFTRAYPDRLEITINESSDQETAIYWSEAYYPDFKAKLVENDKSKKIKAYKAGPGMTLFMLPSVKAGSKIIYEYKTPFQITISRMISMFTLLILIILLLRPQRLKHLAEIFFAKIKLLFNFSKSDNEDQNY